MFRSSLIVLLPFIFGCQSVGRVTAETGHFLEPIDQTQYTTVAIHPTTELTSVPAIKAYFAKFDYRVIDLKDAPKNKRNLLVVTCFDGGHDFSNSMGIYSESVNCSLKDHNSGALIYEGRGKFTSYTKGVKNLSKPTLGALKSFKFNSKPILSANRFDHSEIRTATRNQPPIAQLPSEKPELYRKHASNGTNFRASNSKHDSTVSEYIRTALIIGNADYLHLPSLTNPRNDAEDIASALKKLGFNITLLIDANLRNMNKAVNDFGQTLNTKKGVGLFYYAGHGVQIEGENYMIPSNVQVETQTDVKYSSLQLAKIMDVMGNSRDGLNIVILDACRDNPLPAGQRSISRGLARVDGTHGSFISFATGPGQTAADGSGKNGVYTNHLLRHISSPNTPFEQLFKRVARDVEKETHGKQIPWFSSSFTGDFYFSPSKRSNH